MLLFENVKTLCAARGLSLRTLEQQCGMAPRYIYKWDSSVPSVEKVAAVADVLGVSVDELIGRKAPEISRSERALLDLLAQLNDEGQEAAFAMLQGLARQPGYIKKSDYDREVEEVR